jgi:tRNA threonylcarbamoyladenosine biosynthesis protein TsaB
MRWLSLDTSRRAAQVAVTDGDRTLAHLVFDEKTRVETALRPGIERLLREVGLSLSELDGLACGIGPGSFTGLRIGLAFMRVLAWSASKPVYGLSALLAQAGLAASTSRRVLVLEDDHPRGVYAARIWTGGDLPRLLTPIEHGAWEQAVAEIEPDTVVTGSAIERLGSELRGLGLQTHPEPPAPARVCELARLAEVLARRGEGQDPWSLLPLYVQDPSLGPKA